MAEEAKAAAPLNLAGVKSDSNAQPKANNADQTAEGAPNGPGSIQTQTGDRTPAEDIVHEAAAQAAADQGVTKAESGEKIYSSHPVTGLQVGRFRFENGTLRLSNAQDIEDFQKVLDVLPPADRNMIRTLDMSKVNNIVEERRLMTRSFDSSVGREAMEALRAGSPTIGREDISHAALAQQNNNIPVTPTEPVDPEGKTGLDQGPHIPPA